MSPHIEYWGIPSPAEELYAFPLAGDGTGNGETMRISSARMFVLNMECEEEDADFIPETFE
jgi:hypothetical protein